MKVSPPVGRPVLETFRMPVSNTVPPVAVFGEGDGSN